MSASAHSTPAAVSPALVFLMAAACGLIVANLYYSQPLAGPIAAATGMSLSAAGLVVTLTQIGYGLGLLLIVPLGDRLENRRLICAMLLIEALALLGAAAAGSAPGFLAAVFLVGLSAVVAQILVPFAAQLAPLAHRGRLVGQVMSGLLSGIMLARPVASLITWLADWHLVYLLSSAGMAALAFTLWRRLPLRQPQGSHSYPQLIASLPRLWAETPILRRRAFYQACMFGCFSLFWTTVPLFLASPAFGFSQFGIAVFALIGVVGAVVSPMAGRWADHGHGRVMTWGAMLTAIAAFALTHLGGAGSLLQLAMLTLAGVLVDGAVTVNLLVGQRSIYALGDAIRSRLNALFMAVFFAGGAIGSALGGWAYAHGGWALAGSLGALFPLLGLIYFRSECGPARVA